MSELYIPPDEPRFLTPDSLPSGVFCLTIPIPDDPTWCALVTGALSPLMSPYAWRPFGTLTQQESADAWRAMLYAAWSSALACDMVETPFWDDATDVEDSADGDTQIWYGEVTNPTAPPAELDFVETIIVWTFTGLIALATAEIGAAPAIAFNTIATKFIIAQKTGDIPEIIKIVVDNTLFSTINTGDFAPGTIIETPIIADPSISPHALLIMATTP